MLRLARAACPGVGASGGRILCGDMPHGHGFFLFCFAKVSLQGRNRYKAGLTKQEKNNDQKAHKGPANSVYTNKAIGVKK